MSARDRLKYAAGWFLFHTVTHLPGRFWLYRGSLFWWAVHLIGFYVHTEVPATPQPHTTKEG